MGRYIIQRRDANGIWTEVTAYHPHTNLSDHVRAIDDPDSYQCPACEREPGCRRIGNTIDICYTCEGTGCVDHDTASNWRYGDPEDP